MKKSEKNLPVRWMDTKLEKWQKEDFVWYYAYKYWQTFDLIPSEITMLKSAKLEKFTTDYINNLLKDKVFTKQILKNYIDDFFKWSNEEDPKWLKTVNFYTLFSKKRYFINAYQA